MERAAQVEALVMRVVSGSEPAGRLQALSALRRELDLIETELAASALRAGMSWREIGDAIGVTKQAAHRRHSQSVAELERANGGVSESGRLRESAGTVVAVSVQARRAVRLARAQAARLGADEVGTEHLLLGLLDCADARVVESLRQLGVTLAAVREAVASGDGGDALNPAPRAD